MSLSAKIYENPPVTDEAWELAKVLYEARIRAAWGTAAPGRLKWPERRGYEHNRIAEVDLVLVQAHAVLAREAALREARS